MDFIEVKHDELVSMQHTCKIFEAMVHSDDAVNPQLRFFVSQLLGGLKQLMPLIREVPNVE